MFKPIVSTVAWLSLVVLILPSILFLGGWMELRSVKGVMMAATIIWFVAASLGMWKNDQASEGG